MFYKSTKLGMHEENKSILAEMNLSYSYELLTS